MNDSNRVETQTGKTWIIHHSNTIKKWMRIVYLILSLVIVAFYICLREPFEALIADSSTQHIINRVSVYIWVIGLIVVKFILDVLGIRIFMNTNKKWFWELFGIFRIKTKAILLIPISILIIIILELII